MRVLLALAALTGLAACDGQQQPRAAAGEPELALLTSLPIVFGESLSLEVERNLLLEALEERYRVVPVDGPEQLAPGGTLLAIQPQALTAERLVALDRWVRDGGRLLLLADPSLTWESSRPLGDRFRPPYAYPDTGLLRRWGLALASGTAPAAETVSYDLGEGVQVEASGFGRLTAEEGDCRLSPGGHVARCQIGRGKVIVVADADFAMRQEIAANHQAIVELTQEVSR